jgi:thioredoxin-related protein
MPSKVWSQKEKMVEIDSTIQSDVEWTKDTGWTQLLKKAEHEGKLIFIDCYATWCVPCKKMDTLVYSKSDVYKDLNSRFISLKLQMDSTKGDSKFVKEWHKFSNDILTRYNISALPTYLFFNSKGVVLHRATGFKNRSEFINLLGEANDSTKQYYILLSKFKTLAPAQIRELAILSNNFSDSKNASRVAQYYMQKVLASSPLDTILNKNNSKFIGQFVKELHANDKLFKMFLQQSRVIDSIVNRKGYSREIVNQVVFNDYVESFLNRSQKENQAPKWDWLYTSIAKQFGYNIAKKQVIDGKVLWYQSKKDRVHYVKYLLEQANGEINTGQKVSALSLNNWAWDIFGLSNDTDQLLNALKIINLALIDTPGDLGFLDTKANILYKMGYIDQAIDLETKIVTDATGSTQPHPFLDSFKDNLKKMQSGLPTWENSW